MKINQFDRATASRVATIMMNALNSNPALQEMGLTFKQGGGRFDANTATFKVEASIDGVDVGREEFIRYAGMFGLSKDDYGKEFSSNGERFRLTGIAPNRPRFPIQGERLRDGKLFKFPSTAVSVLTGPSAK